MSNDPYVTELLRQRDEHRSARVRLLVRVKELTAELQRNQKLLAASQARLLRLSQQRHAPAPGPGCMCSQCGSYELTPPDPVGELAALKRRAMELLELPDVQRSEHVAVMAQLLNTAQGPDGADVQFLRDHGWYIRGDGLWSHRAMWEGGFSRVEALKLARKHQTKAKADSAPAWLGEALNSGNGSYTP